METEAKTNYRSENMKKARLTKLEKQKKEKEEKEYARLLELQAKKQQQQEPAYIEEDDSNASEEEYTYVPMKKTRAKKITTKTPAKRKPAKPKTEQAVEQVSTSQELEELRKFKEETEKHQQMVLPNPRFPHPNSVSTPTDVIINTLKHKILNI